MITDDIIKNLGIDLGIDWVTHWTGPRDHWIAYKNKFRDVVEAS